MAARDLDEAVATAEVGGGAADLSPTNAAMKKARPFPPCSAKRTRERQWGRGSKS